METGVSPENRKNRFGEFKMGVLLYETPAPGTRLKLRSDQRMKYARRGLF